MVFNLKVQKEKRTTFVILSNKTFGGLFKISNEILKIKQMHALNNARLRQYYKWLMVMTFARMTSLWKTLLAKHAADTKINQAPVDFMTPKERIAHSMIRTLDAMGLSKPTRLAVHVRIQKAPTFAAISITEPAPKYCVSYFKVQKSNWKIVLMRIPLYQRLSSVLNQDIAVNRKR